MEKESFVKKMAELEHTKQKALEFNKKETDKVKQKYIAENCPLKIGDKVQHGTMVGTIEELDVTPDGAFFGSWRKQKKDGEPYKETHGFNVFDFEKMKKVKP